MSGLEAVELEEAHEAEVPVLDRLLQLYLYDFSEIEGLPVDAAGRYSQVSPMSTWMKPGHRAFLVRVDRELAGVVLVKPATDDAPGAPSRILDEFFIMRKFRRRRIGRAVARRVFDLLPGRWCLNQTPHNYPAQAFWRSVLAEYTNGRFDDVVIDGRPTQRFTS